MFKKKRDRILLAGLSIIFLCMISDMGNVNAGTELNEDGMVEFELPEGAVTKIEITGGREGTPHYYTYDENGRIISIGYYDNEKTYRLQRTYQYDDQDHLLQEISYDYSGQVNDIDVYTYNVQGQLIEEGDIIVERNHYVTNYRYYYSDHKMIKAVSYDETERDIYEYDNDGKLIIYEAKDGNETLRRTEFYYDQRGRAVEVIFEGYNKTTKYEYSYDEYDNIDTMKEYTSFTGRNGAWHLNRALTYVKNYDEYGRLVQIGLIGFDGTFTGSVYRYE